MQAAALISSSTAFDPATDRSVSRVGKGVERAVGVAQTFAETLRTQAQTDAARQRETSAQDDAHATDDSLHTPETLSANAADPNQASVAAEAPANESVPLSDKTAETAEMSQASNMLGSAQTLTSENLTVEASESPAPEQQTVTTNALSKASASTQSLGLQSATDLSEAEAALQGAQSPEGDLQSELQDELQAQTSPAAQRVHPSLPGASAMGELTAQMFRAALGEQAEDFTSEAHSASAASAVSSVNAENVPLADTAFFATAEMATADALFGHLASDGGWTNKLTAFQRLEGWLTSRAAGSLWGDGAFSQGQALTGDAQLSGLPLLLQANALDAHSAEIAAQRQGAAEALGQKDSLSVPGAESDATELLWQKTVSATDGRGQTLQTPRLTSTPTLPQMRQTLEARFQVFKQVEQRLLLMKQQHQREIQMQLEPAHLGKLNLRLQQEGQLFHLQIFAESPLAKEILDGQMQQLKAQFAAQGFELAQVEVNVNSDSSEGFQQSHAEQAAFSFMGPVNLPQFSLFAAPESPGAFDYGTALPSFYYHQVNYLA